MKRLPHVLIVLILAAIPLAAQSKSRPKQSPSNRPFYKTGQIEANKPFYRPLKPTDTVQSNKALVAAIGAAKVDLLIERSKSYLAAGFDESAQREFDRALKVDPDNEAVVTLVASLISATGIREQCEKVILLSSDYLAKAPKSEDVYIERAKAKECLRNFEGAFDDVSMALEISPQNRGYWSLRSTYIGRFSNFDYAQLVRQRIIDELEKLVAASKPSTSYTFPVDVLQREYIQRASVFRFRGDFKSELSDLNRAVELVPDFSLIHRATFYRTHKKYPEAIADLTRGIELLTKRQPNIPQFAFSLYHDRAETYLLMEKFDEAIADYQTCMTIYPRNAAYHESKIASVKEKAAIK